MQLVLCSNTSWNIYNFRMPLIKKFLLQDYKIYAFCNKDEFTPYLENLGIEVIDIKILPNKINIFRDIFFFTKLIFLYLKFKPDVVLNFTIKPVIFGSLASIFFNHKTINTITGLGTTFLKNKLLRKITLILYYISQKKIHKLVFQNHDDMNFFLDKKIISKDKSIIIPGSGVDVAKFVSEKYPINQNIKFLFIGRLIVEKGIYELIDAIKKIKSTYKNIDFDFVGSYEKDNPSSISYDKLSQYIKDGLINYYEFNKDVKFFINNANCIILPSYREGMPKSLLESMSMSRPIITTNVPGCKDLIIDNHNGFICSSKNSESIVSAIIKFINLSSSKKILFGSNSRKIILNKYGEKIVINKYMEIITS